MTNQPPAKQPREFLILYRESNRMFNSYRIDDSQLANEHLNDQTYRNAGIPQREAIHVIEKSYADRMEQELAFVKTQWKQTSDLLEQERKRLTVELADVRKERDELRAELAAAKAEIDRLQQYNDAARLAADLSRHKRALELALYYVEGDATYEGVKEKVSRILEGKE